MGQRTSKLRPLRANRPVPNTASMNFTFSDRLTMTVTHQPYHVAGRLDFFGFLDTTTGPFTIAARAMT